MRDAVSQEVEVTETSCQLTGPSKGSPGSRHAALQWYTTNACLMYERTVVSIYMCVFSMHAH